MSKYGTIIDFEFNPMKIEFKNIVIHYFNNPTMTKIKQDFNNKSVYMVNFKTMLAKDKRYLIVNTPVNNDPIGSEKKLSNMEFDIIQMKELDGYIDIPIKQHSYSLRDNSNKPEFNCVINMKNRTEKFTEYECPDYDVKITMIHKEKYLYEYPDTATLLSAIEKFSTLIFID